LELFTGGESERRMEDCIIIDNNIFSYQKNLSHGIIVPKYGGDPKDKVLEQLGSYLNYRFTLNCEDVRPFISKDFKLNKLID
jgi:TFIIF-interacting CTD phosphatase-like protein